MEEAQRLYDEALAQQVDADSRLAYLQAERDRYDSWLPVARERAADAAKVVTQRSAELADAARAGE